MMPTDTPFNMAMLYYSNLQQLISYKSQTKIENNIIGYYETLEEIFVLISFKLTKAEKKEIEDSLNFAGKRLNQDTSKLRSLVANDSMFKTKKVLRGVDITLLKFMDKYKMIFPNIALKGFETIRKKYDLDTKNES